MYNSPIVFVYFNFAKPFITGCIIKLVKSVDSYNLAISVEISIVWNLKQEKFMSDQVVGLYP